MDIDKLIRTPLTALLTLGFGSLMDIDKLIPASVDNENLFSFGSLMDIDKLIRLGITAVRRNVLVL